MEGLDLSGIGLTRDGARTLRELSERLSSDELAPLNAAIDDLQTYVGLLHVAAGDPATVKAFADFVLAGPLPDRPLLIGGRPLPGHPESPCSLGVPHPITFTFAGLNAADAYAPGWRSASGPDVDTALGRDPSPPSEGPIDDDQPALTWIDRAFAGWAVRAGGPELALDAGRRWLDGGDPGDFRTALALLRSRGGVLPTREVNIPCLDERQVCISEFVFTALRTAKQLSHPSFPTIGSVTPPDQCQTTKGPITLLPPAGQQFPSQAITTTGIFATIDRDPATILSWTPQQIRLALPTGIEPGCHEVGWMYLFDTNVVSQLRAIGEQCRPWFGGGGALATAPYAVWEDQGRFSLIGAPSIGTFHGPNGSTEPSAEACTPVPLSWAIALNACPGTAAQQVVTMWRDGQLFRVSLPTTGQLVVSDAIARTYTLRAQARLPGRLCGQTERSVSVSRFNVLRVQIQGREYPEDVYLNPFCVQPGIGVTLNVRISCPAPQGGLPVTVASSHPGRVAGASGAIDEGATGTAIEVLAGNECGTATLTVSAPNHSPTQVSINVQGDITISAISPDTFPSCDPVSLTVDGSCFPPERHAGYFVGVQLDDGKWIMGERTVLNPGTRWRVDLPALPAGSYLLMIERQDVGCALSGYAPVPFTVTGRPPIIIPPLKTTPTSVEICSTPTVTIEWTVQHASGVSLTRGGTIVANRFYSDPCASVTDSVTETLPTVTGPVSYTLTAFNADGTTATNTQTLPLTSSVQLARAFVVQNVHTDFVNVFLLNYENQGGIFVGTLSPNATLEVPLPSCRLRQIHGIDPQQVSKHNADFGDNLSATAVSTARTSGPWQRGLTWPLALGFATAGVIGILSV